MRKASEILEICKHYHSYSSDRQDTECVYMCLSVRAARSVGLITEDEKDYILDIIKDRLEELRIERGLESDEVEGAPLVLAVLLGYENYHDTEKDVVVTWWN